MPGAKLYVVVGCPGSGKSHFIRQLIGEGYLDEHLNDALETEENWADVIAQIRRGLLAGKRLGLCGQSFRRSARRERLQNALSDVPKSMFKWVCFEFNAKACLSNIIKDALNDRGYPRQRAHCVLAVLNGEAYEIPDGVTPKIIKAQEIAPKDLDDFLRRIEFSERVQGQIREIFEN